MRLALLDGKTGVALGAVGALLLAAIGATWTLGRGSAVTSDRLTAVESAIGELRSSVRLLAQNLEESRADRRDLAMKVATLTMQVEGLARTLLLGVDAVNRLSDRISRHLDAQSTSGKDDP